MRQWTLLVTALMLAGPAAAEGTSGAIGPVSAHVETSPVPSCALPAPGLPCPLGYEDAGTITPTDDTIYQYQAVESVVVAVDAPVPLDPFSVDLRDQRVRHGLINDLDAVFLDLRAVLPPPLRERTWFKQENNGSIFRIILFDADPVTGSPIFIPVDTHLPWTNRDGTRIPNGIIQEDSDVGVPHNLELLGDCDWLLPEHFPPACNAIPLTDALPSLWASLTPRIITGAQVNGTSLIWGSPEAAQGALAPHGQASSLTAPAWDRGFVSTAPDERPASAVQEAGVLAPTIPWSAEAPLLRALEARQQAMESIASGPPVLWLALAAGVLLAPLAALYQRITRERALLHEKRVRMLELARSRPGLLMAHAAEALGLSYHTARHHARILARCGHLQLVQAGHSVALYPTGLVDAPQRSALVHLRRGPQADVLRQVRAQPGISVSELAAILGTGRSSACAKLKRLEIAGLTAASGRGRYAPTPLGLQTLALLDGAALPSMPAAVRSPAVAPPFGGRDRAGAAYQLPTAPPAGP